MKPVRHADDAGHATVLFVLLAVALLACAGLVVDGGRVLAVQQTVSDQAEHAARAGAAALDLTALRSDGRIQPDRGRAAAAARAYLARARLTGRVTVSPAGVTVEVRQQVATSLFALAGARTVTVVGRATARPITVQSLRSHL